MKELEELVKSRSVGFRADEKGVIAKNRIPQVCVRFAVRMTILETAHCASDTNDCNSDMVFDSIVSSWFACRRGGARL